VRQNIQSLLNSGKAKSGLFLKEIKIHFQRKYDVSLYFQHLDAMATIGENTKKLRAKRGLNQDELVR
jgi:hypothetical protein